MNAAMSARINKEAHPERYCRVNGCLWRVSSGPCRKHGPEILRPGSLTDVQRDRIAVRMFGGGKEQQNG